MQNENNADLHLERFISLAAENMQSAPGLNSQAFQCIKQIDDHWLYLLFANSRHTDRQAVCTLVTNAHNFFRASISLVFAGQPTPVYSLLRTSLESSLYAAMISNNLKLENIWLHRTAGAASRAACRRAFSATEVFGYLESKIPLIAKDCKNIYDMYIEYGAHPNINGTFTFIKPELEVDPNAVSVNYLQGSSQETRVAAFQAVQLAELTLHLALHSMPNRTAECGTGKFLEEFSPKVGLQLFGLPLGFFTVEGGKRSVK